MLENVRMTTSCDFPKDLMIEISILGSNMTEKPPGFGGNPFPAG